MHCIIPPTHNTMKPNRKRDKFVELAEKRVTRTIRDLRLVGNLSNKGNYSYTDTDVNKLYKTLQEELKAMKARFQRGGEEPESTFKL